MGVEKILFGSDFPLISPQRYFRELEGSGLSREDQEKILGLNFSKLLRRESKA
jgi:predicted TIM-barrel fold metal-dependent hydrolase